MGGFGAGVQVKKTAQRDFTTNYQLKVKYWFQILRLDNLRHERDMPLNLESVLAGW